MAKFKSLFKYWIKVPNNANDRKIGSIYLPEGVSASEYLWGEIVAIPEVHQDKGETGQVKVGDLAFININNVNAKVTEDGYKYYLMHYSQIEAYESTTSE